MRVHVIEPCQETLHGHFARELEPVLTIAAGDRVRLSTLDAGWRLIDNRRPFERADPFAERDLKRDPGHALCGPIAVEGARAGMTLEVRLIEFRPATWGWSSAGGFPSSWNVRLGLADPPERMLHWMIDRDAGRAHNQLGQSVRLRPFMGVLGMPPAAPGWHSTFPPRRTGGNIDCKELIEGSRLFLPIEVDGALFSVGDGHALQGDGEVAGPALECPMERVEIEFHVHADLPLRWPRAIAPAGWITFGFHEDLDEAVMIALDGMLDLMAGRLNIDRKVALSLASLVVDMRVTQIVNGVVGAHALLPRERIEDLEPGAWARDTIETRSR